jgi:predicted MFS family arabinose efflux permease
VPKEALDSANSLMSLIFQLGTFLGAVPAGIIVAYKGSAFAFALNSFSFAIAVLAALLMAPLNREARSQKSSLFHDALQGLAYLGRFPWLITILLMDGCAAIAAIGPTAIGLPLLASTVLHIGSQGYSLLLGSFGCGSIIGILLPAVRSPRHHRGRFFCLVQLLEAPLLAGIGFVPVPLAMLCLVGVGLLNGFLVVLLLSLLQANIAKEMLGRMMSFWMLAGMGFVPLSQYASGLVANFAGIQILFTAAGVLTMLGAILGLMVPSLRHLD